jgi:hypothetical protein
MSVEISIFRTKSAVSHLTLELEIAKAKGKGKIITNLKIIKYIIP